MELARESRGFLPVLWMDKLAQRGHVHSVPSVLLWPGLARENSLAWDASQHPTVLCLILCQAPCFLPPSTGMTHEDIVQESKKYWQQMEAHAGKASSGLVRLGLGTGVRVGTTGAVQFLLL